MEEEVLYHYTTMHACNSILLSKKIWMSDCRFLNDRDELDKALSIFLGPFEGEAERCLKFAFWHQKFNRHYCVCCFSKSPEILSQWRGYADDGTGVALGFSRSSFRSTTFTLIDCIYDDHGDYIAKLRDKHEVVIDLLLEKKKELIAANSYMQWLAENHKYTDGIIADLLRVKNPAFREEQEVRALASFSNVSFRVSNNVMIPYKEMQFWTDPDDISMFVMIPEVWLGPKCPEINEVALQSLRYGFMEIKKFDCGYR